MILAVLSLGHSLNSKPACEKIKWLFFFSSEFGMENVRATPKQNLIFDVYTKRRLLPPLPSKTLHYCVVSLSRCVRHSDRMSPVE